MATQRNTIKIANPPLDWNQQTQLTSDINIWVTTLNVSSTIGFDTTGSIYLLIGEYWNQKSEIVLASWKTDTTFTVWAIKYSHSSSDSVTILPYNQIKFYWRTVSGGSNNLLATLDIDCTQQFTTYTYTWATYSFFVTSYYRSASTTEESDESDEISILTFNQYSAKKIIESGLRKAMTRIDENPDSSMSWSAMIDELNNGLQEIITRKKRWRFLHKLDTSKTTTANVAYLSCPDDLSIVEYVIVNWRKIDYKTKMFFDQIISGDITSQTWEPQVYTLKDNKVYFYPTPATSYQVTFEYYSLPAEITSLTDQISKEFAVILVYYIASMSAYIRWNEKRWDKMYAMYSKLLEQQVEDMTWYEQVGDAESVEFTSNYWPYFDPTNEDYA